MKSVEIVQEISNLRFDEYRDDINHLGSPGGWWLIIYGEKEATPIAKFATDEDAYGFADLIVKMIADARSK